MKIGIFPHVQKQGISAVLGLVVQRLLERGAEVALPADAAEEMGYPELGVARERMLKEIAVAVTLGGDGTLLSTARAAAPFGIPVCGINMGQLGFLTEVEPSEVNQALDRLVAGQYSIEERLMLDASIFRQGKSIFVSSAVNDVVVTKGGFARMIRLNLYIDGQLTANYPADGLIIATPTGSTGYSLSAGGPIVSPGLKVIVLTPICPHTLHSRSLIVAETEEIKVTVYATHQDIVLTMDGQTVHALQPNDTIIVRRSRYRAKFIRFNRAGYYETVYTKLTAGR